MVLEAGIEPACPTERGILSPLCLPIPPLKHVDNITLSYIGVKGYFKKMPPEGGDLFIGGVDDGDVDVCVDAHDDNDADDLVSRVLFDPLPTEYVYEDIDSIYIAEHDQHTNALESKLRWHDNILVTKPKPLRDMVYEPGSESVTMAGERVPHILTRKHQIVLL